MGDWQPISTVPKDAKSVIIAFKNGEVVIGPPPLGPVDAEDIIAGRKFKSGWVPTFWMPVPEAPGSAT